MLGHDVQYTYRYLPLDFVDEDSTAAFSRPPIKCGLVDVSKQTVMTMY